MASLNTLRTKFGIVLSIIIALALLAFILSLKTEMGFSGNDPRVGVIDGEKINYSEYYDQYEQIKAQSGAQENDEQQAAMLANATWQSLISKYVMTPGFERLGLRVTEPERMAMISGEQPSQTLYTFLPIRVRVPTTLQQSPISSRRPRPILRLHRLGPSLTSRLEPSVRCRSISV